MMFLIFCYFTCWFSRNKGIYRLPVLRNELHHFLWLFAYTLLLILMSMWTCCWGRSSHRFPLWVSLLCIHKQLMLLAPKKGLLLCRSEKAQVPVNSESSSRNNIPNVWLRFLISHYHRNCPGCDVHFRIFGQCHHVLFTVTTSGSGYDAYCQASFKVNASVARSFQM